MSTDLGEVAPQETRRRSHGKRKSIGTPFRNQGYASGRVSNAKISEMYAHVMKMSNENVRNTALGLYA